MPVVFRVEGFFSFFSYLFKEACFFPYINSGCFLLWLLSGKWYWQFLVICFLYVSYDSAPKHMHMFLIVLGSSFFWKGWVRCVNVESESLWKCECAKGEPIHSARCNDSWGIWCFPRCNHPWYNGLSKLCLPVSKKFKHTKTHAIGVLPRSQKRIHVFCK